jgi:hypothetical protein
MLATANNERRKIQKEETKRQSLFKKASWQPCRRLFVSWREMRDAWRLIDLREAGLRGKIRRMNRKSSQVRAAERRTTTAFARRFFPKPGDSHEFVASRKTMRSRKKNVFPHGDAMATNEHDC